MTCKNRQSPNALLRQCAASQNLSGAALITSLLLLTVLTLLGLAAISNTQIEFLITTNHRNGTAMLHLAEAGVEHAREVLRTQNAASEDPASFTDELLKAVGPNGVLDGFVRGTDDVPLIPLTASPLGNASGAYIVYLSNDRAEQRGNPVDSNGRITLTAVATLSNGAQRIIENEVIRRPGPAIEAAIYAKDQVTLDGAAGLRIDGYDNCLQAVAKPPVYTLAPALTTHQAQTTLLGNPAQPQQGPHDIDIVAHLKRLKAGAASLTILSNDQIGVSFGTPTDYVSVYSDTTNPTNQLGLHLLNVMGYGILLVKGDLTLGGSFEWNGLVLVSGHLTLNGGGNNINIRGAILTQGNTVVSGSIDVRYDSCSIDRALSYQSLSVESWKETY
ncbi:MAG: hypothetical protein O7G88_11580 [bacterium]|nr:hypothetical protein [bacterium]